MDPVVSICCITYNQVDYIEDAIDSILSQKTSFPFEVLIHDDASSDGTLEKLQHYEDEDSRIRVFKESKNRYKDGISYINEILIPSARGKYIAICEGDDYWISNLKLQKSVEYLESHPHCSLYANAALLQDAAGEFIGEMGLGSEERDLSTSDLVNNWHIPTASFVFKKTDGVDYAREWTFKTPVGDFPRAFYLSTVGYIHYCPECLSVYRYGSTGSWTVRNRSSLDAAIRSAQAWLEMLVNIDDATKGEYHSEIIDSAASKVMRLYGRIGKAALDAPLAKETWNKLKATKKLLALCLRLLGRLGFDLQRRNWSGLGRWAIVRIDRK